MRIIVIFLFILLTGCKPESYPAGEKKYPAELHDQYYLTEDGNYLPLRIWLPDKSNPPRAIIIGVHGFNDYSKFFQQPAEFLSKLGIICFAYDQRGFGASSQRGFWAGTETYTKDLQSFVHLVKHNYPDLPVYLLGESMGGAVVIASIRDARMPKIDGIILIAPAVWPREIMPWYQTSLLWVLAHTMPWLNLSGEGWAVQLSDNREMIRALDNDPLVLRKTRVESMYGLTDLMDLAFYNASYIGVNTLLLYGEKDNIIPKDAIYLFLNRLFEGGAKGKSVGFYQSGYHMLLRDLNAEIVWKDISAWIFTKGAGGLPSGADTRANNQINSPQLKL
ncbi:MAG: alpha/beta hydrolase [Methylococcaceae bacterium]|nr:alpha/beta hydrolase [Methylococcaceae bacterium]